MAGASHCPKCNKRALFCSTRWKKSRCFSCDWEYAGNYEQVLYEEALERCAQENARRGIVRLQRKEQ